MKRKKRTRIILISILLVVLIAGGIFFVYKKLTAPKPPDQVQDKNSNTYKQNETLFASNDNKVDQQNSSNNGTVPVSKPIIQKSASTAPSNVNVDFTCIAIEGVDCQISLTNTATGQVISLEKKKITKDRIGQTTAYWVWQTVTGKWQIVATASNSSSQASSDTQIMEVK